LGKLLQQLFLYMTSDSIDASLPLGTSEFTALRSANQIYIDINIGAK